MRTDGIHLTRIGATIPPSMPVEEAIRLGHYDRPTAERDGWTGAATAGTTPPADLAVSAARTAIAGLDPDEFALVMHASLLEQGPDGWSSAYYIQQRTVGGSALAMEIRQGCTGMLAALELAATYLSAADHAAALITGADNFGQPVVNRWRYAEGVRTNRGSILGDAGTAMVVSHRPGVARLLAVNSASLPDLEQMYRGEAPIFPLSCDSTRSLDYGTRVGQFAAHSPDHFAAAKQRLAAGRTAIARATLAEAGVCAADIARVTHVLAGNNGYIAGLLGPLGIDPARGMLHFGRGVGHLGVNDHIAALDHLLSTGAVGNGDLVMMLGNGVGIGLSCAVLEITA